MFQFPFQEWGQFNPFLSSNMMNNTTSPMNMFPFPQPITNIFPTSYLQDTYFKDMQEHINHHLEQWKNTLQQHMLSFNQATISFNHDHLKNWIKEWEKLITPQLMIPYGQFSDIMNNCHKFYQEYPQYQHIQHYVPQIYKDIYNAIDKLIKYSQSLSQLFEGFASNITDRFYDNIINGDKQFDSIMALFNEWTTYVETEYHHIISSHNYQKAFGDWANSLSQLKLLQQQMIDSYIENFGLPSSREMDVTHERIQLLKRQNRQQSDIIQQLQTTITDLQTRISILEKNNDSPITKESKTVSKSKIVSKKSIKKP